ncbi:MAG TPA: GNAT family N-acetyltransferase [Bacteroidales bacterium]|nr:GNAT family N-acetyltransferase [Bacteroidales bacterium]
MTLVLQQIQTLEELYQIKELYISSFPAGQRDSFEGLRLQLDTEKDCSIYQIKIENTVAGFFTLWRFQGFSYLEHIATMPNFRCKGMGREVLSLITSGQKTPLLLEIEKPHDALSLRRLRFYERNGFHLIPVPYSNPCQDRNNPGTELLLMVNKPNLELETIQSFVNTLYRRVYHLS